MPENANGSIAWHDLTVPNAPEIRDFYADVIGWTFEGLDMGDYEDFVMSVPGGDGVAGVCHARGVNAKIPPQWLMHVMVPDLAAALVKVEAMGGKVLTRTEPESPYQYSVIQDPAGAVLSLMESPKES